MAHPNDLSEFANFILNFWYDMNNTHIPFDMRNWLIFEIKSAWIFTICLQCRLTVKKRNYTESPSWATDAPLSKVDFKMT